MKFMKMQGCGNDYVYINCFDETVTNPNELAKKISDRHFGVGSDGLVLILPSDVADCRMRMFNADGSESEMCGNAIRCVGKYVYDKGIVVKNPITVETLAGNLILDLTVEDEKVNLVKVDMGEPILDPEKVPVKSNKNPVVGERITAGEYSYDFTCVSMGNPHAVTFIEEPVKDFDLHRIGPKFEIHEIFPNRTNTEFVRVLDRQTVEMRVWERGAGETLACGTGACGVVVACILNGLTDRKVTVHLVGGDLMIEWDEATNHVFMTGPAEYVFEGTYFEA